MPQLRRSTVILRAYNIDHKKGQVWATTNERSGCDFIIFNHLTKLLFCLHYCLSSDCSLTMSVKTSDPKAYFTIKNMASQIWCLYLFLFCTVGGGCDCDRTMRVTLLLLWSLSFDHGVWGGWWRKFDDAIGGIVKWRRCVNCIVMLCVVAESTATTMNLLCRWIYRCLQ